MRIFNGLASWSSSKFGLLFVNVTMPLREVLGDVARGAKIERWIAQARELAGKGTT